MDQSTERTIALCADAIGALPPHERVAVIRALAKRFNAEPPKGWEA